MKFYRSISLLPTLILIFYLLPQNRTLFSQCSKILGVTFSSSSQTLCVGEMLELTPVVVYDNNATTCDSCTFTWQKGGIDFTSIPFDPVTGIITIPTAGVGNAGTYQATLTCPDTTFISPEIEVIVVDLSDLRITPEDPVVCQGQSVELMAVLDAPPEGVVYNWQLPNNSPSSGMSLPASLAGEYEVVAMIGSCSDTALITVSLSDDVPMNVVVNSTANEACDGDEVTLTAVGDNIETYLWSNDETSPSITVSAGTHTVTVTSNSGCTSVVSKSITSLPTPTASLSPASPQLCPGDTLMVTVVTSAANVDWNTGSTEKTIAITNGGMYAVTVTGTNGCFRTIEFPVNDPEDLPTLPRQQEAQLPEGALFQIPITLGTVASVRWELEESVNILEVHTNQTGTSLSIPVRARVGADPRAHGGLLYKIYPTDSECSGDPEDLFVRIVPQEEEPFIPELFSPNGDGVNDTWILTFPNEGTAYSVVVYNRYGALVYEGTHEDPPWDGSGCENSVNYYRIHDLDNDRIYQGAVTILGKR